MNTRKQYIDLDLIRRAQRGRRDSESLLAELAEQVVFPYLYRLTLNYHLSQDLCQETLIEMHKSLKKLEFQSKRAFFAWIYRTALSKVQRHFRRQGNRRLRTISQSAVPDMKQRLSDPGPDHVDRMIQKELLQAAVASIRTLKLSYRNVLTLRCFDGLSYQEIASIEGRSQIACRIMFCKAKKALRKNLAHRGFDNSYLLPALALLGTVTLTDAASAVALTKPVVTGALSAGKGISMLSMIVSKATLLVAACLMTVFLTVNQLDLFQEEKENSPPWTMQYISQNVRSGVFACPAKLIRSDIPAGEGLVSIDPTSLGSASWQEPGQSEETIDLANVTEYLDIDDPRYVRLQGNYWLEFVFGDGFIVDGPGPDIFVTANGCKSFWIILTDGGERQYEFALNECPVNHNQEQTMPFDLEGHNIGFKPKALRILVNDTVVESCGFELQSICARVKQ